MFSIEPCNLPDGSLLQTYSNDGAYTDCYATGVNRKITLPDYLRAFYTTVPFRMERTILSWAIAKPSTDGDVDLLAEGRVDRFAAWTVEARCDDQILLSDYRGRTRSWLMCRPSGSDDAESTRLYFGSAVVPTRTGESDELRLGKTISALLLFHKLYSRILLSSARVRLSAS